MGTAFCLDRGVGGLLEYRPPMPVTEEVSMAPITADLLRAVSQELSHIPTGPEDLATAAAQLAAQDAALARLDELPLLDVEPATALLPPQEISHGAR